MEAYKIYNVNDGIDIINIPCDKSKTNMISISFALPLSYETASLNSLLIMLLSRRSKQYDSIEKINRKLANMYGAELHALSAKIGENQVLKISITALDDRFALDNKNISSECVKLLLSLVLEPCVENNAFIEDDVDREKNLLIEKIKNRENEKNLYAIDKTVEIMFEGEPYAVNPLGSYKKIRAINSKELFCAYQNVLSSAKILISSVGNVCIENVVELIKNGFAGVNRNYKPVDDSTIVKHKAKQQVKYADEKSDITQCKLIMGFDVSGSSCDTNAFAVFNDIFGGGVYSKLFMNVREKMSLCYYCSSKYDKRKGFIYVSCGCEDKDSDKVVKEVMNQIAILNSGDFDSEFDSSKISFKNLYSSVSDTVEGLESWYSSQITDDCITTPEDKCKEIMQVTKEQIAECSKKMKLDTVFKIQPVEDEKDE